MFQPRRFVLFAVFLLAIASLACRTSALQPTPILQGAEVCRVLPELCNLERCAGCPDRAACMESGGRCPGGAPAVADLIDTDDGGPDVFRAGCHWYFDAADCTGERHFLSADACLDDGIQISEWTNSQCHAPQGDIATYNCNTECIKEGFTGGHCVDVPNRCAGNKSAQCECTGVTP